MISLDCTDDFSLSATLISGQCFRWTENNGVFLGTAFGVTVKIRRCGSAVMIEGDDSDGAESRWRNYLDLDTDYEAIRREVVGIEPRLADASEKSRGLHILNQEPWEALCSFIISQNNNIPRIRGIISRLCELCAEPAVGGGYSFPSAQAVSGLTEKQLAEIGCGYRVSYILAAAEEVRSGNLLFDELRQMPVEEARKRLLKIRGVGPKVADCMLLYGLHRLECFPRDVWIKRALEGEFRGTPLLSSPYAGVAQQYIFDTLRAVRSS